MAEPIGIRRLDSAIKALEQLTRSSAVSSRAVEWRKSTCKIYMLVQMTQQETSQTELGPGIPEITEPKPSIVEERIIPQRRVAEEQY